MNVGDYIKRTNSWHWLAWAVAFAVAASVVMPDYGWMAVAERRRTKTEPALAKAEATLDALKSLDEAEAEAAQRKAAEARGRTQKLRDDFASYGMEPLPAGDGAAFAAQSRIAEALAKRNIRILSAEAKADERTLVPPAAKAEATKRGRVAETGGPSFRSAADKRHPLPPSSAAAFATTEIAYEAEGDFRDIFMFLVGETAKKPNYWLKDIFVAADGDGGPARFTFRLEVASR